MPVVSIYKPLGLTPLQALDRLRKHYPNYQDSVLSYAGRLDPLAEGLMLVLVDEANQEREKHLAYDKVYELEILCGFSTDTGDILGLVTEQHDSVNIPTKEQVDKVLQEKVGEQIQTAPKFSAPGIDGKDYQKTVTIYSIEYIGQEIIDSHRIGNIVASRVNLVSGDFRQGEIIRQWRDALGKTTSGSKFPVIKCRVHCSSGTYMRLLAENIGNALGIPALALSIIRTKVGEIGIEEALQIS